jgi:methylmalonyl-CoA carboxyltransferase 1.3S subunit
MDEVRDRRSRKGSGTLKLQITIDGTAYEVDVEVLEDEEDASAPSHAPQRAPHASTGAHSYGGAWDIDGKICRSPVTGLVIKVNVEPGQALQAGEQIMVLEAMKMETNVTAPHAGTVKSVHVAPGDSVKVNQILVECE